MEELKKNKTIL